MIQRLFRGQRHPHLPYHQLLCRYQLHALLDTPVEATVKWDGTNVGKCCDGSMLGRRRVISDEAKDYQKTTLTHVQCTRRYHRCSLFWLLTAPI